MKSFQELVESEKQRRHKRLSPHFNNDVWKRRSGPPPDWNSPLPDYIAKEYEFSYLAQKAEEMKNEEEHGIIVDNRKMCIIS